MLSTAAFVEYLGKLNLTSSGLLEIQQQVRLDPASFLTLLNDSPLRVIPSSDGAISVVKETGNSSDFSQQSGAFDLHTDGLYYDHVPEYVLLYCVNPGKTTIPTIFTDTRLLLRRLKEHHQELYELMEQFDMAYIHKDGRTIFTRSLIEPHPATGQPVVNLGARAFLMPRLDGSHAQGPGSLMKSTACLYQELLHFAEEANVLRHIWRAGDLVLFDNNSYIHGRDVPDTRSEHDSQRELIRIWLSRKEIQHQDLRIARQDAA